MITSQLLPPCWLWNGLTDWLCPTLNRSSLLTLTNVSLHNRPNRSTDDAISFALHVALTHMENPKSYVRMLFVDYNSVFKTIDPIKLVNKLQTLGLGGLLCHWIKNILTNMPQHVRLDHYCSSAIIVSTKVPQGSVLSTALYCLFTHNCTSSYNANTLIIIF